MGKKLGATFHLKKNDKCGRCGMTEKKGGCCSDETKFFKLDLKFKAHPPEYKIPLLKFNPAITPESFKVDGLILLFNQSISYDEIEAPPFGGPPIFIRNCNFRL